jgi:crossover junction endodeoxyribonuclease RuvC
VYILGIDPGVANTGYGVVSQDENGLKVHVFGCIKTPQNIDFERRLQVLYIAVNRLLSAFPIERMALEELYMYKNVKTALMVGQAKGICMLAAAEAGVKVFEYTPLQIKLAVSGYGRANKSQIQKMICKLLNLDKPPKPDDAADALAVAVCCINSTRIESKYSAEAKRS